MFTTYNFYVFSLNSEFISYNFFFSGFLCLHLTIFKVSATIKIVKVNNIFSNINNQLFSKKTEFIFQNSEFIFTIQRIKSEFQDKSFSFVCLVGFLVPASGVKSIH